MKLLITAVGLITILATPALANEPSGRGVPTLNLQSCRDAQELDPTQSAAVQTCFDDEQSARDQLVTEWRTFSASDRQACSTETQAGGPPSYVELLICLQDARIARTIERGAQR